MMVLARSILEGSSRSGGRRRSLIRGPGARASRRGPSAPADGEIDAIADYGKPLSTITICRVLGIPAADGPRLEALSDAFFYLFAPIPSSELLARVDASLAEFRAYAEDFVAARALQPQADLISALTHAREGGVEGLEDSILA